MSALGKYRVIEAETLEECKYHRALIEQALLDGLLPPELRAELKNDLDRILARAHMLEQIKDDEEERKKKSDDGSGEGDRQGGSGDASSGGSAGGDSGVMSDEEETGDAAEASEIESFALLFFLAEQAILQPQHAEAVAAATLVLQKEDKIAELHEPFVPEQHPLGNFLASLERHATHVGAHVMQLKLAPDAVEPFRRKFGYEPFGKPASKGGVSLQRVRKSLRPPAATPSGTAPAG